MKRTLNSLILGTFIACFAATGFGQDDIVMKAMRDEMNRSMKKLQLENLEKPYFLSYSIIDTETANVSASFGSLLGKVEPQHGRYAKIQLRVGDYKLDNRNFFSLSSSRGGSIVTLPLDDNYDEIRRQLWLATDSAYKKAVEDLSKKRALLQNKNRTEIIPDFSKEKPVTMTDVLPAVPINAAEMESLVRGLSGLFKQSPAIATSQVSLQISNEYSRYVNSEGAATTIRQPEIYIAVTTSSQAADGQPVAAGFSYRGRSMKDLPPRAEMEAKSGCAANRWRSCAAHHCLTAMPVLSCLKARRLQRSSIAPFFRT